MLRRCLALLMILLSAEAVPASAVLREELAGVAKNIKKLLDGQKEDSIALGQFTGPASYPTSSGPAIVQVLAEELKKIGVTVKQRAKFGIKGEYHPTEVAGEDGKLQAVQLKGVVEDGFGNIVTDFSFRLNISGESTFIDLLGVSVHYTKDDATPEERAKRLKDAYANPKAPAAGTRIRADKNSPYAVEVLIGGKARAAKEVDALPFVPIERGESYVVRLINDSPHDAAVRLAIDGLGMFTFSEVRQPAKLKDGTPNPRHGEPLYGVVIVPARDYADIKGWHRTNKESDAFLVTEYAKSAAGLLYHKVKVGTITATFAAAWPASAKAPADEPPRPRNPDLTGFGERLKAPYTEAPRIIGSIRAAISVRYSK